MKSFWTFFISGAFLVVLFSSVVIAQNEKTEVSENANQVSIDQITRELQQKADALSLREQSLRDWEDRLKVQEDRIKSQIEKLDRLESARLKMSKEERSRQEIVEKNLVKTYESMNPAKAANVLTVMEEELAVELLMLMKSRNVAQILDKMDPNKAMILSSKIAERRPASSIKK